MSVDFDSELDSPARAGLDFWAHVSALQRRTVLGKEGACSEQIQGTLTMIRGIDVKRGDQGFRLCLGEVVISSGRQPAAGDTHLASSPGAGAPAVLELRAMPPYPPQQMTLRIELATNDFDSLQARSDRNLVLDISGTLMGLDYFKPLVVDEDLQRIEVKLEMLAATSPGASPEAWVERNAAQHLEQQLQSHCLGEQSQVHTVIGEIAASLAKLDASRRQDRIFQAGDLLEHIRRPFMSPRSMPDLHDSLWVMEPDEFKKALSDMDTKRAGDLRHRYDTLWRHYPILKAVMWGEREAGALKEGFHADVEQLEELAAKLLTMPEVSAPTLEWALLDALIYAECQALARSTFSGDNFLGAPLAGELKGTFTGKANWKRLGRGLVSGSWRAAKELVKLVLTFWVASILAQDNNQTAWIITVGVTAARWIRGAVLPGPKKQEERVAPLLETMAAVHECLKTQSFNSRSVRDQLDRVTAEGAVFSAWVYHLLDARIARGDRPPLGR